MQCAICHHYHSRISCPVCGAWKNGTRYQDIANGREIVRGLPSSLVSTAVRFGKNLSTGNVPRGIVARLVRH